VNINFQQIYEDEVDDITKELLKFPRHYSDLTHETQRFVEELIQVGYNRAIQDALDPEVLEETAALSREMSDQLSSFSGLVKGFLLSQKLEGED